jgi:hypothetical protein
MSYNKIKDKKFKLSNYIQVVENQNNKINIYDLVLSNNISISNDYKDFLLNYNSTLSLEENLEKFTIY